MTTERYRGSLLVGPALVLAGIVVWFTLGRRPELGWFAYAPLSTATADSPTSWSTWRAVAAALVLIGLVIAAVVAGRTLGRRPAGPPRPAGLPAVVVGPVLSVGGLAVLLLGHETVVVVGGDTDVPPEIAYPSWFWSPRRVLAAGAAILGLLLTVGAAAYRLTARHHTSSDGDR